MDTIEKGWLTKMLYINIIAIITVALFFFCYRYNFQGAAASKLGSNGVDSKFMGIVWLLLGSFLIRLVASVMYAGHSTDMNCFYAWSKMMAEGGYGSFYTSDVFTDYPPGYVYILSILGFFLNIFKTTGPSDVASIIVLKMPAMLADLAIGYIIYKIAKGKFGEKASLLCAGLYIFNPAVFINSTIWGQVDSVYTLCVVFMCYQLTKKKYNSAIMVFAIGALLKPQTVIFTPVLLFVCVEASFIEYKENKAVFAFHKKTFTHILLWSIIGIATMLLLMLPFGINEVFQQYMDTLASYEYATVNGYNLWMLLGKNWVSQTETLFGIQYATIGTIIIYLTVIFSGVIYFKSKREESRIFITGAFINIFMFLFAVRMHERYMYPALVLLLIAFLYRPNIKLFGLYTLFTVAHFYNVAHALFYYDPSNYDWKAVVPKRISAFTLVVFVFFVYVIFKYYINGKSDRLDEEYNASNMKYDSGIEQAKAGKVPLDLEACKSKIAGLRTTRFVIICGVVLGLIYVLATEVDEFINVNGWVAIDAAYRNKVLLQFFIAGIIITGVFFVFDGMIKRLTGEFNAPVQDRIMASESKIKLGKKDYLIMLAITIVYSAVALYNLGYNYAPESMWSTYDYNTEVVFDFGEVKDIKRMSAYLGNYENREYTLAYRMDENEDWTMYNGGETQKFVSVFCWNGTDINIKARYVKLTSLSEKAVINELVFLDHEGNQLIPVNESEYAQLFDEQEMYEAAESYRSGTYFDEIYHARTAYEYMHGLYSYENTHPPFGKIIIALGMTIFGVNPFGWRIMGVLFGIGMLPLIYVFGRKFFKETWLAGAITFLFAVDFMHFAQTRIATIDVFVTFFIILMYYFMYQYTRLSFYDTKLSKTFIPLGLCGITMGFSIATKMTGVYAAVGLAIIFFINLYKRFSEYQYAKTNPTGVTNGISHSNVVESFIPNTVKTILFCILVFILIPATIYTLSYIPFVKTEGMGLIERMLDNQATMFNYHSHLVASHSFSSNWFQWPMMYRPIWYYSGEVSSSVAEGISAFGNPLVWWVGIPAFIYTVYYTVKKKDKLGLFLIVSYLSQYVPWILIPRLTYIYHYFPSVPFVIMMIAYCSKQLVNESPKFKRYVFGYLVASLVLFIMFYPVLSGMPVSKDYVSTFLRWFDSWVLLSR